MAKELLAPTQPYIPSSFNAETRIFESRRPQHVGWVPNRIAFSKGLTSRSRDSLILKLKSPSGKLVFPGNVPMQFKPVLRIIADHYVSHVKNRISTLVYFNYDRSCDQDLAPDPHTDGTPESQFDLYSVSSINPTMFYIQTARSRSSGERDDFANLNEGSIWRPQPYEIVRFHNFTIHKSAPAVPKRRTFMRVAFGV